MLSFLLPSNIDSRSWLFIEGLWWRCKSWGGVEVVVQVLQSVVLQAAVVMIILALSADLKNWSTLNFTVSEIESQIVLISVQSFIARNKTFHLHSSVAEGASIMLAHSKWSEDCCCAVIPGMRRPATHPERRFVLHSEQPLMALLRRCEHSQTAAMRHLQTQLGLWLKWNAAL